MKRLLFLIICGLFVVSCNNDYISKKREGMKPYPHGDEAQQAEEAKE